LTEEEKKSRKKAERERKRQEARENAEKKKRFGLTPEKKRKLKLLIMQKATEDLKNEAQRKMQAKKNYLDQKVQPLPELQNLNEGKPILNIGPIKNAKFNFLTNALSSTGIDMQGFTSTNRRSRRS